MKTRLLMTVFFLSIVSSTRADVILILNDQPQQRPVSIEYIFGSGVVELQFDDGLACTGEDVSQPGDGLTVRLGDEHHALNGDVVFDFTSQPFRLVTSSETGQLECAFDRLFRDAFI